MEAVSRSPATLDEVARAAGVSRATASSVFSGNPQVSEAAAELDYVPNRAARSLPAGRTESVGVLLLALRDSDALPARLGSRGHPGGVGPELAVRASTVGAR